MITLRRSEERVRAVNGGQESWRSFNADSPIDPSHDGFRTLKCLREEDLAPGAGFEFRSPRSVEVLTYVWQGTIAFENSLGKDVVLETGECYRSAATTGASIQGTNPSKIEPARIFQCFLTPDRKFLRTPAEKRRFLLAERRGILRLMVSRDGRDSSLRVRQDADVYSSILDPGQHLIHELPPGRCAWLHVVKGRVQLIDRMLEAGDGASIVEEPAVSLTAREQSEILLFDLF